MKIKAYLDTNELELEVYKVQVALFGGPSVLIYNEDRTQIYETHNQTEIEAIRKFIGKDNVKVYIAGYQNKNGQIVMEKVIPNKMSQGYRW